MERQGHLNFRSVPESTQKTFDVRSTVGPNLRVDLRTDPFLDQNSSEFNYLK